MALSCLQARSAPVYKIREPEWLSPAYNNQGAGIVQLLVDPLRLAARYGSLFGWLIHSVVQYGILLQYQQRVNIKLGV